MVLSLSGSVIIGPYKCVSESEDLLHIQAYSMLRMERLINGIRMIEATLKNWEQGPQLMMLEGQH